MKNNETLMKIALVIEYKGTNYYGWQKQKSASPTVEEILEKAIEFVANHKIKIFCAGRTDSRVHSTYQVIHFETNSKRENHGWLFGINSRLPSDIRVSFIQIVDKDFHARFSALYRRYNYIIDTNDIPNAITSDLASFYPYEFNVSKMNEAAQLLLGKQDFTSFRATRCQASSPNRDIQKIKVFQNRNFIIIDIQANAFLYHMVRNIAGALMVIGRELETINWFEQLINKKDRTKAPAMADAKGLYLVEVGYDKAYSLPKPKDLIFTT